MFDESNFISAQLTEFLFNSPIMDFYVCTT